MPPTTPVDAALIDNLYRNLPVPLIFVGVIASLTVLALRDAVPASVWGPWLVAALIHMPARFLTFRAYRRRKPDPADAGRWARYATLATTYSGLVWGVGSVIMFVPGRLDLQLVLLAVQVGMAMGSVFSAVSHLPAVYSYFWLATTPFAVRLALEGDTLHLALGGMCIVFIGATSWLTLGFHRTLRDSVALRFENVDLVEELRHQKDAAEQANLAKSRFLAAASHDLRQPLQALTLFNATLALRPLAEPERQIVEDMGRSLGALDGLFNSLLDISRLDAGVIKPDVRDFPLGPLFERIAAELGAEAASKGIRLLAVPTRRWVRSDPILCERVVRNLVTNGVRHTPTGGVVFGCRRRGDAVRIEVWDSGPGIPADQRRAIFQEFHQLANPERDRNKGLGLGLAIVDRLTQLLGHALDLRSQVGRGSVFSVTLPMAVQGAMPSEPSPAREAARLIGARVLVIDDEADILRGMGLLLEGWGCRVTLARSVEGFLATESADIPPALILSDYRLEGGASGIEAIARLREEYNHDIPALIVSGDIAPKRLREAQAAGLLLLNKPIQPDRLQGEMLRLLGG